jgi:hypothetical protein
VSEPIAFVCVENTRATNLFEDAANTSLSLILSMNLMDCAYYRGPVVETLHLISCIMIDRFQFEIIKYD